MKLLVFVGIALALVARCHGVTFTRCQLVHQLRQHGFPEAKMRDWVCLVESESGRNTKALSPLNKDGTRDYGLFQINDQWCSRSEAPGKECHVTCSALLSNNISDAASCAKKIYQQRGFNAWFGWQTHCRGKTLPDIRKC